MVCRMDLERCPALPQREKQKWWSQTADSEDVQRKPGHCSWPRAFDSVHSPSSPNALVGPTGVGWSVGPQPLSLAFEKTIVKDDCILFPKMSPRNQVQSPRTLSKQLLGCTRMPL